MIYLIAAPSETSLIPSETSKNLIAAFKL